MAIADLNADAAALLAALGIGGRLSIAEAHAQGYYSVREWSEKTGVSPDTIRRRMNDSKFCERIAVNATGAPSFYRLKRQKK